MKVCLFADSFLPKIGGMELVIHNLANALSENGCGVVVVAKHLYGSCSFERNYELRQYGNRFPGSGRLGTDALCAIIALLVAQKHCQFDILNCHSASYAGSRVYLARKMGLLDLPVIITPHGEDIQIVEELKYGLRLDVKWDAIIKRNLAAADSVTAISDTVKHQLDFIAPAKIHKIPNGIHFSDFNKRNQSPLHKQLSISLQDKIVLSVGRHRAVKGYMYGIQAFKEVLNFNGTELLKYVIVGKDSNALLPFVKELNLEGRVFLLPQMEYRQLISAYQSAWCFLSPSLSEGLSLVSIEAMACGLPLLVTDVPGNVDIVQDNECGLIVPPGNPMAIAQGLVSMLTNTGLYKQFAAKALANAKHYDWTNIARQYIRVYHQTIQQHRQARAD